MVDAQAEQELKDLKQQAARQALLTSDVTRARSSIVSGSQERQAAVTTQITRPQSDLDKREEELRKQIRETEAFWDKAAYKPDGTPRRNFDAVQEKKAAALKNLNTRLKAVQRAREKGISYVDALKTQKRKDNQGPSTTERLQARASQGDEEARAILQNKQRWLSKAQFSTRVIPKYDGETTGLKTGIYTSPTTGRPVVVREGGATVLPSVAQARYTDPVSRPAQNLYNRDYTVYATVREPVTTPVTVAASARPPQEPTTQPRGGYTGLYAPPESVTAQWYTNLQDTSTDPRTAGTTEYNWGEPAAPRLAVRETEQKDFITFGQPADVNLGPVGLNINSEEAVGTKAEVDLARSQNTKPSGFIEVVKDLREKKKEGQKYVWTQVALGSTSTVKSAIEDPGLTLGVAGAYYLAGQVGGPAGVGTLFAAQNVLESKTGQTPTVVRAYTNPSRFAGEIAPFVALEGARVGTVSAVKSARATAATEGTVATPALLNDPIFTRDLSVEVRGEPVTAIRQQVATVEQGGVSRGFGVQQVKTGDPVYLTPEQIKRLPWTFITDTNVRTATATQTLPSSKPGLTTGIEYGDVSYSTRGRTTIKQVQEAADNTVFRFDVRGSDVGPGTVRLTRSQAETTFTPYDPPATSELVVPKTETGPTRSRAAKLGIEKTGGQLNEPPAKLDFFESIVVEGPRGVFAIQESPYTGALRTGGTSTVTPFVVKEIIAKPTPKAQAEAVGKGTGTGSSQFVEVEVRNPDGTVSVQKVKVEFEPPAQETQTKTETKTVQEQKAKTKEKTLQQQRQEAAQSQTVAFKRYQFTEGGKTVSEAIIKFRSLSDILGRQKLKTGQQQRQAARQGQDTSTKQLLEFDQALDQPVAFDQGTRQRQQTEQRQDQGRILDLYTPSRGLRPGDPVPVEELTPKVPGRFNFRDEKPGAASFDLLVKQRGKFIRAGRGLGFKEAAQRGALITGTTAAASFKLQGDKKIDVRETLGILGPKFRRSKASPDVFVERSRFRIDTPGEVGEISRKGQAASRKKRNKRGGRFKWVF